VSRDEKILKRKTVMTSTVLVSTKDELKQAINDKIERIVITDAALAKHIRVVKSSAKWVLTAAIAAAVGTGVAATNFWNPAGWAGGATAGVITMGLGAAGAAGAVDATLITAIIVLGLSATILYAIYSNYDVKGGGKITLPNGTELEGELNLERK
jgi:hypothetical protein